jgi:hypothetical protein
LRPVFAFTSFFHLFQPFIVVLFTRSIAQLRALPVAAMLLGLSLSAQAQTPIAITGGTSVYAQTFDGITPTGTTYPAGWAGLRYGRSATGTSIINEALSPVVQNATSNAGAVYNAGADGDADRALGSLASASNYPAYGAVFVNNSGAAITRVSMAGRAEQWRTGSNNTVNETIVFEYSLDATNLNSGTTATWTPVTGLDLTELITASTVAGPLDGNAAANSRNISGVITGINWPAGTTMWIRWRDTDDLGSDALLAVDNFALATGNTVLATQNQALQNSLSTQTQFSVDVAALKAGVYTVRFTTQDGVAARSFVKQ